MQTPSMFQKFSAIVWKWMGKRYEESYTFGYQCVSWAKEYCSEVWYPLGWFSGSAINGWYSGSPFNSSWKRIPYLPWLIPSPWDVVFFRTGQYWHVAIAWQGSTISSLVVIEQNAATGNGKWIWWDAIRTHTYDYKNPTCVGWFTIR